MIKIHGKSLTSAPKIVPTLPHMKYPTLQKVTLTTMALVASLALSARAGTPSTSSAVRTHGMAKSLNPIHRLLFPASTYQIDDGTMEDAVGFGDGFSNIEALWFNQFDVIPGQTTITSVSVAWGTPNFPDPSLDGEPVTIAVWSDPNGDGNPSDASLLGSVNGVISQSGTDTFVTYTFSTPVALPAGATSFFAGDLTPAHSGFEQFFQGLDENSTFHRQSWVAANAAGGDANLQNPGQNDTVGLIDDFGLPGNWGIRADAGGSGGSITLNATLRRSHGNRFVVLTWSPADGGQVNVVRNGSVIGSTADDGSFQQNIHQHSGTDTYQVCTTDTNTCSNVVTVTTH
jgi:hypothetical protein